MDLRRPWHKMSKNPLSVLNRRHFSCSFPSGTSSSCLYLTVILKFLISRTMCKLKLKEIIPYFFSSKVQLLSKNSSQSCLCSKPLHLSRSKGTWCWHTIPIFQCTAHGAAASSLTSTLLVHLHACPVKLIGEIQLPDSNIQMGFLLFEEEEL